MKYGITFGEQQTAFPKQNWALYCGRLEICRKRTYDEILSDIKSLIEMGVDVDRLIIYNIEEVWTAWPVSIAELEA